MQSQTTAPGLKPRVGVGGGNKNNNNKCRRLKRQHRRHADAEIRAASKRPHIVGYKKIHRRWQFFLGKIYIQGSGFAPTVRADNHLLWGDYDASKIHFIDFFFNCAGQSGLIFFFLMSVKEQSESSG